MPHGIKPPSVEQLAGIKPRHRTQNRQDPSTTRDKTGNGDHTTPMEAIIMAAETQHTTDRSEHRHVERHADQPEVYTKPTGAAPVLSKSALRDIQTIKNMEQLSSSDQERLIADIVRLDLIEANRWGQALDVLVVGGAVILVVATGFVTLSLLASLMAPAPMPPAGQPGA
jgi:hypothetical protein